MSQHLPAKVLAFVVLLVGCGAPRTYRSEPGIYDRVPRTWREPLSEARLAFERGDLHAAFLLVAPLAFESGRVIPVRAFLQEIELALRQQEGSSLEEARVELEQEYSRATRSAGSVEAFVLAARLAPDVEVALDYLQVAEAQDPRCVWVYYGRAWWRHRERSFKEVRADLQRALRIDGGHLPSMRLHATMLAGAGDIEDAARVLDVWLERTRHDPLFAPTERADAMLDLAALEVFLNSPKRALRLIEELDPRAVRDPVRAQAVLAAAHQARGDYARALDAVRRAMDLGPSELLPVVQEALLLQALGDVAGERAAWEHLMELTAVAAPAEEGDDLSSVDFEAAIYRLQASTRLERLELLEPAETAQP